MTDQTNEKAEPTQQEVESAWLAHNGARVGADADRITGIEAMRIALRAAEDARHKAHQKHEEFTDGCDLCMIAGLRRAHVEIKNEYAGFRGMHRGAMQKLAELADTSGSISPETLRRALRESHTEGS